MKTIRNKTVQPLRVPLPGGKVLHLGPRKEAQIADNAAEHAGLQKLVSAGSIEILGEGERVEGSGGGESNVAQRSAGRGKSTFRRGSGER